MHAYAWTYTYIRVIHRYTFLILGLEGTIAVVDLQEEAGMFFKAPIYAAAVISVMFFPACDWAVKLVALGPMAQSQPRQTY